MNPAMELNKRGRNVEKPIGDLKKEYSRCSFSQKAKDYFDSIARDYPRWREKMFYYIFHTTRFIRSIVPPNKRVLLIGGFTHELLESLEPSYGVGVGFSAKWVELANSRKPPPNISYQYCQPEDFVPEEKFDYVILINVADFTDDLLVLIGALQNFVNQDTTVIISMLNPLWHRLIQIASALGFRIPDSQRNLVASRALITALEIKRFRVTQVSQRILIPKRIPLLSWLFNQFLVRLPVMRHLAFIQYVFAKPLSVKTGSKSSCSIIIPCFNEEDNIVKCIERVPKLGSSTEILVVNDGSTDNTLKAANKVSEKRGDIVIVSYEKNRGKGAAVLEGMRRSRGDIIIILDADMTVPPEELVEFFEAIDNQVADFVTGTRFLYPMEREAMRFANYFGNILFSKLVEIIVGMECSDTLCGTKAMRAKSFTDFKLEDSSWGDFDLIFHAAKRRLKCVEIPVHYKTRLLGISKMNSFRSGIVFLRFCLRKWIELP